MSEANSYVEVAKDILEHSRKTPAQPSWLILDSQFLATYPLAGNMRGIKKPKSWFDSGFLRCGETIEALANACDINPQALRSTVERFNRFAEQGHDEDFQRGTTRYQRWLGDSLLSPGGETLGAIEQAPFYAIPVYPGDVGTFGGLVTDITASVLRIDGTVINGLYATGTTTASVMGQGCPGAGASIGPALTWGYVAAKAALISPGTTQTKSYTASA